MFVQLLKTTPYLSGQQKLDVCLRKVEEKPSTPVNVSKNEWIITTGDCRLSPISESIPFNDSIKSDFFNKEYGDHVRDLYRQLKDDFFRDLPAIKSKGILYEDDTYIDTSDHTYECGLKRLRYEKYKNQFSWLCPLWIDDPKVIDRMYFILTIYGDHATKHSMMLKIIPSKELVDSLKQWFNGVTSDLMYIDIDREKAYITGASVESGTPVTMDVSYIVPQLLDRERPVMETNSTLNQLFSTNNIIAKQLLNLNFCFSLENIIPAHMISEFIGKRWKMTLDTYVGPDMIDKVDFLSNYEYLPVYTRINDEGVYDTNKNVFDYLKDDKYIDYKYINKTTQVDPYWTLVENPNYIYNFYNGFSSWYTARNGSEIVQEQTIGLSESQPDVAHKEYNTRYNNLGWCEIYDFHTIPGNNGTIDWSGVLPLASQAYETKKAATRIVCKTGRVSWINGLKYDLTYLRTNIDLNFKLFMCLTGDPVSVGLYAVQVDDAICLFVPTDGGNDDTLKTALTLRSIIANPPQVNGDDSVVNKVKAFFSIVVPNLIYPTKIVFNRSIFGLRTDGPVKETEEIEYIKQEYNVRSYVYRYSGALRPFFISPDNENYYNIDHDYIKWSKKSFSDPNSIEFLERYNKMLNLGYSPDYPSIGFYALNGDKDSRVDYFVHPQKYDENELEFPWYEDGRFYALPLELEVSFIANTNSVIDDNLIISKLIMKLISLGIPPTVASTQISLLYNWKLDYSYVSDTDISRQLFKVKYTLR